MSATLRHIAYRALPLGHLPQLRYQPGGRYAVEEGVRLIDWGDVAPGGNVAVALGDAPPLARVLAIADAFFAGRPGGYGVRVDGGSGQPIEAELQARGWQGAEDSPSMVITPVPTVPAPPAELTIRRVITAEDLEEWFHAASPGARGPDHPPEVDFNRLFIPSLAVAHDPAIALFTGYLNERPVASSGTFITDDVAEVAAVATWPEVRRRGYGTALTWAAIAEGMARGCESAALRASALGKPVYAAMGFTYVCTFRTYSPP
ncbi:MAG: GNAT family N-acetyltransferase [Dehalococcoidia bacterium]